MFNGMWKKIMYVCTVECFSGCSIALLFEQQEMCSDILLWEYAWKTVCFKLSWQSYHTKVMVAWSMIRVVQWVGPTISGEPAASIFKVEETLSTLRTEAAGSWFQTFAVFWMSYAFFWVIPWRLICRCFGTLCLFHLHRQVGVGAFYTYLPMKMEQAECSKTSAYKIQTPGNYPEESIRQTAGCFVSLVPIYQTTQHNKIQVIWVVLLCLSWDE